MESPETTYFRKKYNSLSSAWRRFTVLFGMGRSGTTSVWPPGKGFEFQDLRPDSRILLETKQSVGLRLHTALFTIQPAVLNRCPFADFKQHGYRIKPHEQLVSVSSTPHSACTPDLSTSWSRTTLQGGPASGKTYLQASFPLRCFQRLSLPHIATRRCHWRDNRYTRGASTPVLSY